MNDDQLWTAIDEQRLRTVHLLLDLSPDEWARGSLCDGWTVRDVAAHLTLQQLTLGAALRVALRHPGSLNHTIRESARARAGLPTERIVDEIRTMVGSRRHNIGVTPLETLIDITVHGQDIAIPLGRDLTASPEATATAASRVWSYGGTAKSRKKAKVFRRIPYEGFRLEATDADWSAGDGLEVRGPVLALLLLLTGRPIALAQLTGEGATTLTRRLGHAR